MKTGRNLQDLAAELMRRSEAKADYIVDSAALSAQVIHNGERSLPVVALREGGTFGITEFAHGQMAEKTGIPRTYYNKLITDADGLPLWQANVNHWLQRSEARRMVRTLDNDMRALLSDRYHRVDNEHVAQVALPALLDNPGMKLVSCEVTDRKLYLKATVTNLIAEVRKGDVVRAGVALGNSEIGDGSIWVDPFIERLVCTNGMTVADFKWKRAHVGSRLELPDGVILAEDTMRAEDSAILLKMRDMILAATSEVLFQKIVGRLRDAAETVPVKSPQAAVQLMGKTVGLLQREQEGILERLIQGRDYTLYGMANAITNLANDTESYDRASELERIGGQVITLPAGDWRRIAETELRQAA